MQYNLAQYSQYTSTGSKSLTYTQLINLVRDNTATITLSGSNIMSVDVDLGERILANEARYYFNSSFPSTSVVSGVVFYAKLGPSESWTALTSNIGTGYYYATITGSVSSPRYVRLTHTISGTSISGTAQGFQIINNEDIVNFGEYSDRANENFNMSLRFNSNDVREVAVYNSGLVNADAYVSIEPQKTTIDEVLFIGSTASGSWYGLFDEENKICGADKWINNYDYWSSTGKISNTRIYNNTVILNDTLSGTYTTRVFSKIDDLNLTLLNMVAEYPTLYSGIVFQDNFTNLLGTNWSASAGGVTYTSGYLNFINTTNAYVQTVNSYNNNHDCVVTMKIYAGGTNSTVAHFYPFYVSATEYVSLRWRAETTSDKYFRLFINDIQYYDDTRYDAWTYRASWFWLKVHRYLNTIKYKLWRDGESEPDWITTITLPSTMLPSFDNKIRIYEEGYTTQPLRLDDVVMISNYSSYGNNDMKISVNSIDTEDTIEIRSSNAQPENFHVTMSGIISSSYLQFAYKHIKDNSLYATSANIALMRGGNNGKYGYFFNAEPDSEYVWGVVLDIRDDYYYDFSEIYIARYNQKTNTSTSSASLYSTSGGNCNVDIKFLSSAGNNYCWVYMRILDSVLSGAGYYLMCYNNALTRITTIYNASDFVKGMCIASTDGSLWYSNSTSDAVIKINNAGTALVSYPTIDVVGAMCASGDGGCFVLQQEAILKIKYDGSLDYYITGDFSAYTSFIALDMDESGNFWLIDDGSVIKNIFSDGTLKLSFDTYYDIYDIRAVYGGLWIKCNYDTSWRFFDKALRKITKVVNMLSPGSIGLAGSTSTPPFYSLKWSDENPDERFPTSVDSAWSNLSWKKISVRDYSLPSEFYNQVRFTLRASSSGASPILKSLYKQNAVKIDDIQPGHYKNVYLKVDISSLSDLDLGNYNSNLKTWWYIPE
jgi:hypothetical protein